MVASGNPPSIQVIRDRSQDIQPVTAVISQRVKRHCEADYERWTHKISEVARQFPGHLGVTTIRPEAGICVEYVTILKFDCYTNLKRWLDSDERQRCLEKAKPLLVKASEVKILTGFETWFTLPNRPKQAPPPRYKMAILTTFAVFGAVNLLNPWLLPLLIDLGLPRLISSLMVTYLVVLLLTYLVMPRLTKLFAQWLYPA
ncbi:MAG: antibiotic biosynthesis monooxygenase [Cyanobacteria bacterium P01_A01_bin.123]